MGSFCPNLKLKIMEDKRTELQKEFEKQTPTIQGVRPIEYLQTFCSWLHLQVERKGQTLPINGVNNRRELLLNFLDWYNEDAEKTPITEEEVDLFIKEKIK